MNKTEKLKQAVDSLALALDISSDDYEPFVSGVLNLACHYGKGRLVTEFQKRSLDVF